MDTESEREQRETYHLRSRESVESPWRKGIDCLNIVQERLRVIEEVENYEPLGDFLSAEVSFPHVNILLFGGTGHGKSSVVNTWTSVFRKKIFNVARSGGGDHVITTKFSRYLNMSSTGIRHRPLKFHVWDMRGLEPYHLMSADNMRYILEGNIPDKFPLDPSGNISADMPGFKRHPKLDERIHCVAIVQDAGIIDAMQDASPEVTRNIKEMQTVMNNLDIPQVVVLTKVDTVCEDTREDVSKGFYSTKIKRCVGKVSEMLGIPRNSIFPMKNYESETENDASVDVIALLTLKGILNQCDAYLFNHIDTINSSYKVVESKGKRQPSVSKNYGNKLLHFKQLS